MTNWKLLSDFHSITYHYIYLPLIENNIILLRNMVQAC